MVQNDLAHRGRKQVVARISAHTASIRPLVAVIGTFMVAGWYQRGVALAICEQDEREFLAHQRLFEEDSAAAGSKFTLTQRPLEELAGRVSVRRDENTLAGAQSVRFDHQRPTYTFERRQGCLQ